MLTSATSPHQVEGVSFSAERLALRRSTLGASEFPVVVGLNPYRSPLALWAEKRGLAPAFGGNEFTEWGHRLEAVVADKYAEVRGVRLYVSDTIVHTAEPWISATPDRLVDRPGGDGLAALDRGLEVKCRGQFRADEWGVPGTDEVPHDVAVQCHIGMSVTGLRRWDVATLIGGNRFAIYELYYDAEIEAGLIEAGRRFWFDHVLTGVQPAIDGSEATAAFLRRRFGAHGDALRDATPDEARWVEELREVREEQAHLDGREQELKNRLMDAIGEDAGLSCANGSRVTWKAPKGQQTSWKEVALALNAPQSLIDEHSQPFSRRFLATFPREG